MSKKRHRFRLISCTWHSCSSSCLIVLRAPSWCLKQARFLTRLKLRLQLQLNQLVTKIRRGSMVVLAEETSIQFFITNEMVAISFEDAKTIRYGLACVIELKLLVKATHVRTGLLLQGAN